MGPAPLNVKQPRDSLPSNSSAASADTLDVRRPASAPLADSALLKTADAIAAHGGEAADSLHSATIDSASAGGSSGLASAMLSSSLSHEGSLFPVASWDRYEFLSLLGQGGMGAVYKARDRRLHRLVALKFIRGGDERMTLRLLQEARAQARIDHRGVCKVLEVGEVEGKAYIAMQLVDGRSLQQAYAELGLTQKVRIVRDVAEALDAAHQLGIIHREPKAKNSPSTNGFYEVSTEWARNVANSQT